MTYFISKIAHQVWTWIYETSVSKLLPKCWVAGIAWICAVGIWIGLWWLGWPLGFRNAVALPLGFLFWYLATLDYATFCIATRQTGKKGLVKFCKRYGLLEAVFLSVLVLSYGTIGLCFYLGPPPLPWLKQKIGHYAEPYLHERPALLRPKELDIWESFPPDKPGILGSARYVLCIVASCYAWGVVRRRLIPEARNYPLRGSYVLSWDEATVLANTIRPADDPGIWFGNVALPSDVVTQHFGICGTTGSGKTTIILTLMSQVLPQIGNGEDMRALAYDPKQEAVAQIYGLGVSCPVYILNPWDLRSVAWDIARDCTCKAVAEEFATIFMPDESSSQPFFNKAARLLLAGVFRAFMAQAPGNWTLRDVVLAMRSPVRLRQVLELSWTTRDLVEQFLQKESTFLDVFSTIATRILPFEAVAAVWSHATTRISLDEWVKGDEAILVLGEDEGLQSALRPVNQAMFKRISELAVSHSESRTRRTWFFLDEITGLGRLDGLQSLMTKGRSRGCCAVLGFQGIEGLREKEAYGREQADLIVGMCSSKALLRMGSDESAQWASKEVGEHEKWEKSYSSSWSSGPGGSTTSNSTNQQIMKRETVLPSEFRSIPWADFETNGLTGYYLNPKIGVYRTTMSAELLRDVAAKPSTDVEAFIPRPIEQQELQPWTKEDLQRLGLPDDEPSDAEKPEAEPERRLKVVRPA